MALSCLTVMMHGDIVLAKLKGTLNSGSFGSAGSAVMCLSDWLDRCSHTAPTL